MSSFYSFFIDVYLGTYYTPFHIEMATQADKAYENGMRDNANYTNQVYLEEAWQYEEILFGLPYRAPGISVDAGEEWFMNLDLFYEQVWYGIFTF